MLTANRTYYVRTDRDDGDNGLANDAGGRVPAIQKAYDIIAVEPIWAVSTVTISSATGP